MVRVLIAALAAACLAMLAGPALAELQVCNQTEVRHQVSIGYKDNGEWVSEGWWTLPPGDCKRVVAGDLKQRHYYYLARAEGHDYSGEYGFCVDSVPFTIRGDADCMARGYRRELFRLEDTGPTAKDWTLLLNGAPIAAAPVPAPAPPAPPAASVVPPSDLGFQYADFDSGMAPGQLGEPFAIRARFLECYWEGDDQTCKFTADGWEWYAYGYGGTSSVAFDAMGALAAGQRVDLQGDIVNYGDISVEIAVRAFQAVSEPDETDRIWALLQGRFEDSAEPGHRAEVAGNGFTTTNGGTTSFEIFRIDAACPDSGGAGPVMVRTVPETQESVCFVLSDWGPQGFTTMFAGGWQETVWRRR